MSIAKLRANAAQHEYATGLVRADIEGAVKEYDEAVELLWNFTAPDDPCQFDHNGHCQAHSWFRAKEQCPHARAKEIIGADAPAEEKGKGE